MMTLASYLDSAKMSQADFALAIGVKQPTVHRWLHGARPSWEKAAKIEKATGGAVPVSVWANEAHLNPPSSDVSQPMVSCPSQDVGTARADCKGRVA